jgi:hypothetical protein
METIRKRTWVPFVILCLSAACTTGFTAAEFDSSARYPAISLSVNTKFKSFTGPIATDWRKSGSAIIYRQQNVTMNSTQRFRDAIVNAFRDSKVFPEVSTSPIVKRAGYSIEITQTGEGDDPELTYYSVMASAATLFVVPYVRTISVDMTARIFSDGQEIGHYTYTIGGQFFDNWVSLLTHPDDLWKATANTLLSYILRDLERDKLIPRAT